MNNSGKGLARIRSRLEFEVHGIGELLWARASFSDHPAQCLHDGRYGWLFTRRHRLCRDDMCREVSNKGEVGNEAHSEMPGFLEGFNQMLFGANRPFSSQSGLPAIYAVKRDLSLLEAEESEGRYIQLAREILGNAFGDSSDLLGREEFVKLGDARSIVRNASAGIRRSPRGRGSCAVRGSLRQSRHNARRPTRLL